MHAEAIQKISFCAPYAKIKVGYQMKYTRQKRITLFENEKKTYKTENIKRKHT